MSPTLCSRQSTTTSASSRPDRGRRRWAAILLWRPGTSEGNRVATTLTESDSSFPSIPNGMLRVRETLLAPQKLEWEPRRGLRVPPLDPHLPHRESGRPSRSLIARPLRAAVAIEKSIRLQIKAHPEPCDSSLRAQTMRSGTRTSAAPPPQHRSVRRTSDWTWLWLGPTSCDSYAAMRS